MIERETEKGKGRKSERFGVFDDNIEGAMEGEGEKQGDCGGQQPTSGTLSRTFRDVDSGEITKGTICCFPFYNFSFWDIMFQFCT